MGRSNLTSVLTADLLWTLGPLRTRLNRRPAKDIFPPAVDLFSFQVSIKSRRPSRDQRNSLPSIHILYMITAMRGAKAKTAFFKPPPCDGHVPSFQPRPLFTRVSLDWAAS